MPGGCVGPVGSRIRNLDECRPALVVDDHGVSGIIRYAASLRDYFEQRNRVVRFINHRVAHGAHNRDRLALVLFDDDANFRMAH